MTGIYKIDWNDPGEPDPVGSDEFRAIQESCRRAGYGDDPREDTSEYEGITVVGNAIMPNWMAEVFGRMAKTRAEREDG